MVSVKLGCILVVEAGTEGVPPMDFLFSNLSVGMEVATGGNFGLVCARGRSYKKQGNS